MFRKYFILPLVLIFCLCPMVLTHAASKTEITSVRTATRNDADTPFVRTVLELTTRVTPRLYVDKSGEYIYVTLPNAKIGKGVAKSYKANTNVISKISLEQRGNGTDITFKTPKAVTKNDVKVFTLPGTDKNKNGNRVVIDINDKSGKVKQWSKWNNGKIGVNTSAQKKTTGTSMNTQKVSVPSVTVPTYSSSRNYSLTKGLKGKIIALDPGHGGSDTGAIGDVSQEKDITLAIAKKTADLLSSAGAKVIMTRTTDVDVYAPYDGAAEELQARCNIANTAKADVFVCIHIDSYSTSDATGVTAYYNSKTPYDGSLAKYIHNQNMKATSFPDRGTRTANFYVLLHTKMPATLLELGFISNPGEEHALNTEAQQKNFAESIVKGLADYFDNSGK